MLQLNSVRSAGFVAGRQLAALCVSLVLLTSAGAYAEDTFLEGDITGSSSAKSHSLVEPKSREAQAPRVSPAQAATLVRTQVGGQVMSVNSRRGDSGIVYRVKVLNDGHMRVIEVDGQTGQLLNP